MFASVNGLGSLLVDGRPVARWPRDAFIVEGVDKNVSIRFVGAWLPQLNALCHAAADIERDHFLSIYLFCLFSRYVFSFVSF